MEPPLLLHLSRQQHRALAQEPGVSQQKDNAMLNLFVLDAEGEKVPMYVSAATPDDLRAASKWQTLWTGKTALDIPNKVALRCSDSNELLGLMA